MSYVLAVDIGSTRLRCFAFDKKGRPLASHFSDVVVIHPETGASEIDPDNVWNTFQATVKTTLNTGALDPKDAISLGVTCQRNSFLLWNRTSGRPLCNLNTWQDCRASAFCDKLNSSIPVHLVHFFSRIAYTFTRSNRYLMGSVIKFTPVQVAPRLYWALHNTPHAFELAEQGLLCFGTLDSWILWKLTDGRVHATDYSNASSTVLFDTFGLCWSDMVLTLLGIPISILPEIKDTSCNFGTTAKSVFGSEIPIGCIIADQQSAMFAQCCWNEGDMKASLGTGTFLTVNTGSYVHASTSGIYPLVGWKIGSEICYLAEGHSSSTGSAIEWAKKFALFEDVTVTEKLAKSVVDCGGVYFIPAFDGIQVPYEDPTATAAIFGLNHDTKKEHVLRALLESFAFQLKYLHSIVHKELKLNGGGPIKVDGGVANNKFILQTACDLIGVALQRPNNLDMTVLGAAFLAGLALNFWDREDIKQLWTLQYTVNSNDAKLCKDRYKKWLKAAERTGSWYK